MNCRKARTWISMDLDGELPARKRALLDRHLAACADCCAAREQWTGVGDRLRRRSPTAGYSAEAAWADVQRAIRLEKPGPAAETGWGWGWRWAGVAAAFLAVALAASVGLWRKSDGVGAVADRSPARVEWAETSLPGASPMVYEDEESGLVVIWVVEQNQREGGHAGT